MISSLPVGSSSLKFTSSTSLGQDHADLTTGLGEAGHASLRIGDGGKNAAAVGEAEVVAIAVGDLRQVAVGVKEVGLIGFLKEELVGAILVLGIGGRVAAGATQDDGGTIEALGHQEDIGHIDGEAGVVGQTLADVGVEGQNAQLVDRGGGVRAERRVPGRALLRRDRWLLLDTGGLMGMLRRGGNVSGGVGNR